MATHYSVKKGNRNWPGQEVADAMLIAEDDFGNTDKMSLQEIDEAFSNDAEQIFSFLTQHLPQGTVDRLLVKLLDHKKSHFVIPSCLGG